MNIKDLVNQTRGNEENVQALEESVSLEKLIDKLAIDSLKKAFKGYDDVKIKKDGTVYRVTGYTKSDLPVDAAFIFNLFGKGAPMINGVVGIPDRKDNDITLSGSWQKFKDSETIAKHLKNKLG